MNREPPTQHVPSHLLELDRSFTAAAERFGTPLYVYDLATFFAGWNAIRSIVPQTAILYYSVKANPNRSLLLALRDKGAHFEVASEGELHAVLAIEVDPERILFVGPGKTSSSLKKAIDAAVGIIVAESPTDFMRISKCASSFARSAVSVALRINPGEGSGRITMGGVTAFGMSPSEALAILRSEQSAVTIVGLHGYLGTGLLQWQDIVRHTHLLLDTGRDLQRLSGRPFLFIDVGGGFGIPYFPGDTALQIDPLRNNLRALFETYACDYPSTTLAMESGRYIAGPSGVFLTRVLDVKDASGHCFAIVDGGTNVMGLADRYLGQRALPFRVLNPGAGAENAEVTVVGPLCTPTDRLAVEQWVPKPSPGALLAFYQAGAYGLTAAPGLFLGHGFPAEVLLDRGRMTLIRERLDSHQMLAGQPEHKQWESVL